MNLIKIRKNGIFDAVLFLFLDFITTYHNKGIFEILDLELFKILFYSFFIAYYLYKGYKFIFNKLMKYLSYLILNLSLFLNRKYFDENINKFIDLLIFISVYIIISSKLKK